MKLSHTKFIAWFIFLGQGHLCYAALVNGNAESGDLTGWVGGNEVIVVQEQNQVAGTVFPFEGSWFFSFSNLPASQASMHQSGLLDVGVGAVLNFSGAFQTEFDDLGEAAISLFDAGDNLVAQETSDTLNSPNLEWQSFSVEITVPETATSWEVELRGELLTGSFVNVFYDDLDLSTNHLSADFDEDGDVDGNDFLAWQNGFGIIGTATKAQGDANGDGNVDGNDFLTWQNQFGSSNGAAQAVPEPNTALILAILLGVLVGLKRCNG